jgi:ribosomal-protein-alanine N-acetyltransferase
MSSSDQFTLREMRLDDIEEIHAMEMRIFPTPWALSSYRFEVEKNRASTPLLIETINVNGESQIAAYIVTWLLVDEMHIANIAVDSDFRRMGLARRMLRHVLTKAALDGVQTANLEVRAGNQAAQALYAKMGFELVGRRKHYYQDNGEDALLMSLNSLEAHKVQPQLEAN